MASHRRKNAQERKINAPALAIRIDEIIRGLKKESEWRFGREDGITLAKYPHMRVVLTALRKRASMHEHKVAGPFSLFVIDGRVTVIANKKRFRLKRNGLFTLRKAVPHDVRAEANSVLLLTIRAL